MLKNPGFNFPAWEGQIVLYGELFVNEKIKGKTIWTKHFGEHAGELPEYAEQLQDDSCKRGSWLNLIRLCVLNTT